MIYKSKKTELILSYDVALPKLRLDYKQCQTMSNMILNDVKRRERI